jgi:hypothetical protein
MMSDRRRVSTFIIMREGEGKWFALAHRVPTIVAFPIIHWLYLRQDYEIIVNDMKYVMIRVIIIRYFSYL